MKVEIPKAPDWAIWKHTATVTISEGVLLSLDIDPSDYERCCVADAPKYVRSDEPSHHELARVYLSKQDNRCSQISGRVLVALRNVGQPGKLPGWPYPAREDIQVPLVDFVRWSRTVEWSIPNQLEQLIGSSSNATNRWPWGTYETESLRSLADAARRFWVNYDPTDDTTAPKNDEVAEWLRDQRGISDRIAQAMATILRADGIKTGPRS
jgi:hypothetical protein